MKCYWYADENSCELRAGRQIHEHGFLHSKLEASARENEERRAGQATTGFDDTNLKTTLERL